MLRRASEAAGLAEAGLHSHLTANPSGQSSPDNGTTHHPLLLAKFAAKPAKFVPNASAAVAGCAIAYIVGFRLTNAEAQAFDAHKNLVFYTCFRSVYTQLDTADGGQGKGLEKWR